MSASVLDTPVLAEAGEGLASRLRSFLVAVRSPSGGGSGTIWSADGLIVTNHHVVPGDRAEVQLPDDRVLPARVIARDPLRDLAALRVDAVGLSGAKPADSDAVRVGQLVFAIGNPWGQRGTLTAGIVMSKGPAALENEVPLDEAIHADVRLAPGNSGGALTNAEGNVIGINSMIAGGIAIAVPANEVERFLAGDITGRGFLGIEGRVVPLPPKVAAAYRGDGGVLVTDVLPGSPASKAGLLPGDVIVRLDGRDGGLSAIARRIERMRAGRRMRLEFLRGWKVYEAEAEPVARN